LREHWKGDDKAMKCDRRSEVCSKEAKFKVDVYNVKRVKKGDFFKYERNGRLSGLFLCEDHTTLFYNDNVNYEITELKDETENKLEKVESNY
jgi:hypothetical protein